MSKHFPKLMKHAKLQIQEAKYTQSKINIKKMVHRQIKIKLKKTKDKEKISNTRERKYSLPPKEQQ